MPFPFTVYGNLGCRAKNETGCTSVPCYAIGPYGSSAWGVSKHLGTPRALEQVSGVFVLNGAEEEETK